MFALLRFALGLARFDYFRIDILSFTLHFSTETSRLELIQLEFVYRLGILNKVSLSGDQLCLRFVSTSALAKLFSSTGKIFLI